MGTERCIDSIVEGINKYCIVCEEALSHVKDYVLDPVDEGRLLQLFGLNIRNCKKIIKQLWQAKYLSLTGKLTTEDTDRLLKYTSDRLKHEFYETVEDGKEKKSNANVKISACKQYGRGLAGGYIDNLDDRFRNIAKDISIPYRPILLVSALLKEKDALLSKLEEFPEVFQQRREEGIELLDETSPQTIAVLNVIGSSGNIASRETTEKLIKIYNPRLVILFGIAAGIRGRVEVGDILITNQVWDLRKCKIGETGQHKFEFEPQQINSPDYITLPFQIDMLQETLSNIFNKKDMKIIVDLVCGSSDNLIRSRSYMEAAAKTHRKLGEIEMEAAGIAEICNLYNIPFFIVKAISDYGDERKDNTYHWFCCELAACTILYGFLFSYRREGELYEYARE